MSYTYFGPKMMSYGKISSFLISKFGIFENIPPNAEETTKLWSNIWSNPVSHTDSNWLDEIKDDLKGVEKQNSISISNSDLVKQIRRTASWKSPGPDGIHGFWYKNLTSCIQLNQCLTDNEIPEWMTIGRTVLLLKDPLKGNEVGNFHPIASRWGIND